MDIIHVKKMWVHTLIGLLQGLCPKGSDVNSNEKANCIQDNYFYLRAKKVNRAPNINARNLHIQQIHGKSKCIRHKNGQQFSFSSGCPYSLSYQKLSHQRNLSCTHHKNLDNSVLLFQVLKEACNILNLSLLIFMT